MEPFIILSSTDRVSRSIYITNHQLIIPPNSCDSNLVTYLDLSQFVDIESVEIGDYSCKNVDTVIIWGMHALKSLTVGKGVWNKITSTFASDNLTSLESLDIKASSLQNAHSFIIRNNMQLKRIVFDGGNQSGGVLANTVDVEITSIV